MSFPFAAFALQETSEPIQVVAPPERDFEGELQRLRESLEAQVRAAQAEAEKQRRRAEEVPWEPGRCGIEWPPKRKTHGLMRYLPDGLADAKVIPAA